MSGDLLFEFTLPLVGLEVKIEEPDSSNYVEGLYTAVYELNAQNFLDWSESEIKNAKAWSKVTTDLLQSGQLTAELKGSASN